MKGGREGGERDGDKETERKRDGETDRRKEREIQKQGEIKKRDQWTWHQNQLLRPFYDRHEAIALTARV